MAVVGSTIRIDFHVTEDTDLDTLHAIVRQNERAHPDFAGRVRKTVERTAAKILDSEGLAGQQVSVDVELVSGRIPGAPRERFRTTLDVEGEDAVVASVDDAVSTPERARIADAVEEAVNGYLRKHGLSEAVEVIVSVTPVQFR